MEGNVPLIGTDHAPHTQEEKDQDYLMAPSGFPGFETYPLTLLHKVFNYKLSLENFVKVSSENPAKMFNLNKKGFIKEGFDADLIIVDKVQELKDAGKSNLITPAEITGITGENHVTGVVISKKNEEDTVLEVDHFIPLFGLAPKLGPIANWGLEIEKNAIKVNNALDYQTNIPGIYAIGDVNTYPGKLKLILCGFHEATLMCQSAYQRIFPDKKYVMKYTTVGGVDGFDGTRKEAPKAVVKAIE